MAQNFGEKAKTIIQIPFNSFLIDKHDQLPECTPAPLYTLFVWSGLDSSHNYFR